MSFPRNERHSVVSRSLAVALFLFISTFAAAVTHPLFNVQSTTQAPFPSNRFTVHDRDQNTRVRVNLPFPNCATNPSDCADIALLNQLDGFNAQPRISIPFDGDIDVSTANSHNIFLITLPGRDLDGDDLRRRFHPQVIGINQIVWNPATHTLYAESDDHLDQHTTYLLVVTSGVKDTQGNPVQASADFRNFVHDDGGEKDRTLKSYRDTLRDALDDDILRAAAPGISRKDIVVASVFTTQSVTSTLERIRDEIEAAPAPVSTFTLGLHGERTVFPLSSITGILFNADHPTPPIPATIPVPTPALQVVPGAVAAIAFGKFTGENWEVGGVIPAVPTRTGVPAVQSSEDLFFNLFIPAGKMPANGWPVAVFGHGFGDNKNNSPFAVASVLASRGVATLAINAVGHGFGPSGTLAVIQGTTTTILPAGGRGVDQDHNGTFDSTEGLFAAPGPNFDIATRDGLRQTVADLMQVVRAIKGGMDVDGDGHSDLDPNRIYYFGQSLGGIYGTIFLGVERDVHTGVPNVPGGTLTDISRESPSFRDLLGFFLALRVPAIENLPPAPPHFPFNDNSPLRNEPPVVITAPGAIAIQTFEDYGRWLSEPGDPVAWAPFVRKTPLPGDAPKNVIIQFARGDQTVPNPTATALIRSGDLTDRTTFFRNDIALALNAGFPTNPHTFLTNVGGSPAAAAAAIEAQTQIAVFMASDGAITIDPDSVGLIPLAPPLFETPIAGPLPEDLGFIKTFPLP